MDVSIPAMFCVAAVDFNKCNFSCVGTALELYRRIGVPYREVGRGGYVVNASFIRVSQTK
jgi:hypothetical protein